MSELENGHVNLPVTTYPVIICNILEKISHKASISVASSKKASVLVISSPRTPQ